MVKCERRDSMRPEAMDGDNKVHNGYGGDRGFNGGGYRCNGGLGVGDIEKNIIVTERLDTPCLQKSQDWKAAFL
ncbi:hypothetical protein QJS10_CPA05g00302 [Acorus calamus]|uniref:Uncharacterized protein n=1 Tax=Acorus calamus TaxID=4465 RepID=A0AAV9EU24_ACOCL|nr:hypothetical protein QJS10_CPA05g00302 [Acorus calamus]